MPSGAIEPYEGLLFPDTYYLGPDSTPEELLTQMVTDLIKSSPAYTRPRLKQLG